MNLTISPVKTPTFQASQKFKAIRNIPDIPCACCGHKVILPAAYSKAFQQLSKPLAKLMEKGFLSTWIKAPAIYELLTKWAKEEPEANLDGMLIDHQDRYLILRNAITENLKSNPEKANLTDSEIAHETSSLLNDLCSRSRAELKNAPTVMKTLAKFKDSLNDEKLATFEQFEIYARKYPRKRLSEIINLKEVYEYHALKDLLQRDEFREKVNFHFDNIERLLKGTKKFTQEDIDLLRECTEEVYVDEIDERARVVRTKEMYAGVLEPRGLDKIKYKVFDEIDKLPLTCITKDSFIAHTHSFHYSDAKIIESLLLPSMSSFEHIIPRSKGGDDRADNGIVLCADCNEKRKSRPYSEFLKYHPEMPYNTEKQLRFVADSIAKGKLNGYFRFWPIRVAKTLAEYTDGKIKPDMIDYCKKEQKRSSMRREENTKQFKELKNQRYEFVTKKKELRQEIKNVENELDNVEKDIIARINDKKYEDILNEEIDNYLKQNEKK